jgi:hypothetical protein
MRAFYRDDPSTALRTRVECELEEVVVKKLLALALLPFIGCSQSSNFGDDTGDTGTNADGTSGNDGGSDAPAPPTGALAPNISVTTVTVLQAVEVTVVKNGAAATPNAPVIAGRKGVVRAFVYPSSGWQPHLLNGVLTLTTGGQAHVFNADLTPTTASTDGDFTSTFDFDVDAASFGTDTTFLVQVFDPQATGAGNSMAQFPTSGTATSLGVETSGTVKIYVFPINFTAYSAGTAATDANDVNAYQNIVMGMYPATSVVLTVQGTLDYAGPVPQANGTNWSQLLDAMLQKRAGDSTPDVYYYGAFAPVASFDSFCGGGCIAGLSSIPSSPMNIAQKASIGLVYGGSADYQQLTGQTMAHEVGHGHGRMHSPTTSSIQYCSTPTALDPDYPYANGAIGVWGYNINTSQPVDPSQAYDVMGYCQQDWISDYTYNAIFNWVATDNGADMIVSNTPTTYQEITDDGKGTLTLGNAFPVYGLVSGTKRTVTYEYGGSSQTATGFYYPYDHLPGGYLLVPEVTRLPVTLARPGAIHYAN